MSFASRVSAQLKRIAEKDPDVRAFIRVDADEAMEAARDADARLGAGASLSPLDGMLAAVKDNLSVAGKPWTAGINGRRDLIAPADAAAVARLRAAGVIIMGGANMDEAALGAVTDNPTFGRCVNPLGAGLTPGGSSGGSAAALAAGFVDLALGTDTMGSVRVPAAYCGVFGFKPSFDAIDRDGLALLGSSFDTIGPMARDMGALRAAFQALCKPEWLERARKRACDGDLSGLRVGVPLQVRNVRMETPVQEGQAIAMRTLLRLGADIGDLDLAGWDPGKSRRAGLLITEAEGAVELDDLIDKPGAISAHLRAMLTFGRQASAGKIAAARKEIASAAWAAATAFDDVDVLLTPTTPQRAFRHGDAIPPDQADLTALANFAGCPAISLPVWLEGERLPAAVQLLAPRGDDLALLDWAETLAGALPSARMPT